VIASSSAEERVSTLRRLKFVTRTRDIVYRLRTPVIREQPDALSQLVQAAKVTKPIAREVDAIQCKEVDRDFALRRAPNGNLAFENDMVARILRAGGIEQ
jgi:hypothetical protein